MWIADFRSIAITLALPAVFSPWNDASFVVGGCNLNSLQSFMGS